MKELIAAAQRVDSFRLHPLGFFYLQDVRGVESAQRVHVWLPNGPEGLVNDLHQHSFDIESLVVTGRMRSELFRFRETTEGGKTEFAVSYEVGKSLVRPTGRRGMLDALASFETIAGARYRLEAGVIHRVIVDVRPCVSVLTTTERGAPIYSYGVAKEDPFLRRAPQPEEAHSIAAVLHDLLSA
jgi:hypothetical protein